ncbi:unnamed protein product, partial [Closterium sp. Naga37s-1]
SPQLGAGPEGRPLVPLVVSLALPQLSPTAISSPPSGIPPPASSTQLGTGSQGPLAPAPPLLRFPPALNPGGPAAAKAGC